MSKREAGFSLVELMIAMVMFVFVIAAASQVFTSILTQFKQQSTIAETNIEGIIGLEILRRDIEHAGYGLPWEIPATVPYDEASAAEAAAFNDCSGAAPCNPPIAIISGNNMTTYANPNNVFNGSDYLVIKASNVATNAASSKWTHLNQGNTVKEWWPTTERLKTSDRVIVLRTDTRELIVNGASFTTRYVSADPDTVPDPDPDPDPDSLFDASFAPPNTTDNIQRRIAYGVTSAESPVATALRMPFNRADYYIGRDGATVESDGVPDRCAFGTGILRKAVIAHAGGNRTSLPLLDCAADMQVVYALDNNENGAFVNGVGGDAYANTLAGLSAEDIRNRVKEVRVYVLAHEGQYDRDFTFSSFTAGACATCVRVGLSTAFGRDFDFAASSITNWQNYRWKVYTMVVNPNNLI